MDSSSSYVQALEAELEHYISLCKAQSDQLKQYAELQQRSHRLLEKLAAQHFKGN